MTSRRDRRKQAYKFIYNKLHDSDYKLGHTTGKSVDVTSVISLSEIDKLKRGYADPSEELVAALKIILHPVAKEQEIEDYLVKPFLSESSLSK